MAETPGAAMFRTPAEAYDRFVGRYGPELARALIAAAGLQPGDRALDVGCGPGALTTELVSFLGADRVAAVDPSEPFAAACRSRLPGVQVDVAAAEALPFDDSAFDGVLAQLVVNFMKDAKAGGREMCRVARAGGSVSAAVWDYAGEMTMLRRFWDAVVAVDPTAADRDEGRMPFCTPGSLGELWSSTDMKDVQVSQAVVSVTYDGFEDLWQPFELGVGPAGTYTAAVSAERRAALKDEFRRHLDVGEEPFELTARAWIATGTVGR
jgi:SAM-dependent methyltransferase